MKSIGDVHVGLLVDALEIIYRSSAWHMNKLYERLEGGDASAVIDLGFDISVDEYNAISSIGNKLRDSMDKETEYRWDFIMTMIYEDIFVDENGKVRDDTD